MASVDVKSFVDVRIRTSYGYDWRLLIGGCYQSTIADNKVAIFSKSWCPYCKQAKKLFADSYQDEQPKIIECVIVSHLGAAEIANNS